MGGELPIGEEERDKEKNIQEDIECESPSNEFAWDNLVDNALPFSIVRLVP